MSHCRVQSLGDINVMPHCRCNNSICHIENRFSPYFIFIYLLFFNAVWALMSGSFRIVSDTLVCNVERCVVVLTSESKQVLWSLSLVESSYLSQCLARYSQHHSVLVRALTVRLHMGVLFDPAVRYATLASVLLDVMLSALTTL